MDQAAAAAGPAEPEPFFVVGALRSGQTLLRLMLEGHPALRLTTALNEAFFRLPEAGWPAAAQVARHLRRDRAFNASGLRPAEAATADALILDLVAQARARHDGAQLGLMLHMSFARLLDLWPRARVVHLVRDPRAVALSTRRGGFVGTVWHGCEQWLQSERCVEVMQHRMDPTQWVRVRFEDLLADPAAQLRRICGLLCVEPRIDAMLAYPRRSNHRPPDPARAEAWRQKLRGRRLALVQGRCGDLMSRRGYRTESPPGEALAGRGERAWLAVANRVWRFSGSIRRYGPILAAARAARRRLPLPAHVDARILALAHAIERRELQ